MDYEGKIRERLIQLREEVGLTQEQLAKEIGVSRSAVRSWETGENLPNAHALLHLSERYGVPIDYLFGRDTQESLYVGNISDRFKWLLRDLICEIGKDQSIESCVFLE